MPRNALTPPGVFEPDPGNALAPPPSLADAWDVTAPALRRNAADTWAAAKDPQFWQDAVEQYRNALLMGSVAPGPAGRTLYHFTDRAFTQFGGKSRGAVYLADTPEGAVSGGLSGMRERMSSPDEARGPTSADQVPGARTLSVHVPDDLRIYGENAPHVMTVAEHDAVLDAVERVTHPDPKVQAKARQLALAPLTERPRTDLDEKLVDQLWNKYGSLEHMSPEDTAAYNGARYRFGPFRHLSDTEFEAPITQEALKLLGYHGARVADEGGTSLAVMDPSRLLITNPGNPLATNAAPERKGLGLDAAATKVLRDMMPETLQSRSFYSIKPPEMPPRPFADDYKGEVLSDGSGTLTHTVDGQPITARHVVGRRTAGKPDTAITPEGVDDISENVLGAVPQAVAKREMGGDAGRYIHGVDPLTCSRP